MALGGWHMMEARAPWWVDCSLSLLLKAGDRECISGDLLEEYREVVLPTLGTRRAHIWYAEQVLSFIGDATIGLALGVVLSIAVVLTNIALPELNINVSSSVVFDWAVRGTIFVMFGAAGFLACRRTGAFGSSVRAGATVALVSIGVVMLTFVLMDNLFLGIVARQPAKVLLFRHSNFTNIRAYINFQHARALIVVLPACTVLGGLCGAAGGTVSKIGAMFRPAQSRKSWPRN